MTQRNRSFYPGRAAGLDPRPQRRRHRHRQREPLRGRAARSRRLARAPVPAASPGNAPVWPSGWPSLRYRHGGLNGVHRRVLDPLVSSCSTPRGFTVLLVNARHVKNVSGRKSDVLDCQWLQQLMSYGLLRGAFRPGNAVCALRALVRANARPSCARKAARCSTCRRLSCRPTGPARHRHRRRGGCFGPGPSCAPSSPVNATATSPRSAPRHVRIKASADEARRKACKAIWRGEHLFALKQALGAFDFPGTQLAECDARPRGAACRPAGHRRRARQGQEARSKARNAPKFDLGARLFQMCGVESDAHRRDRRDHGTRCDERGRRGHEQVPLRQALRVRAGAAPGHQDHRRQGDERQDLCVWPTAWRRP